MWICYCGAWALGVAEWQCKHQPQFCYQEDVEHSTSRAGGHVIPNQLKLGWPKYCKMCGWPKQFWVSHWVSRYSHHLPLNPSLNNFYVLPWTDSLPLPTLRAPRSICSHCQKISVWDISSLSPESMRALDVWGFGKRQSLNDWGGVREILQVPECCIKLLLGLCSGPHFTLHTTGGTEKQSNTAAAN